ncbi:hypothetical protein OE766_25215 [Pararhizobium sp. YC-54]|uniref:hypothetical protein n=1 Tax=Pararhizobium sp. YC-54 TaxID=2986920 RepID=UPI0021F6B70E|nr:hypothetical protein [Pararhizobium sp. YC-54]MCW0001523.1 hypothetical protein [Pararhizobium sp. YC-54]
MRSRQNFIVEFKNRRQAKSQVGSIWGDTDLKAIAREVEDDLADAGRRAEARPVVHVSAPNEVQQATETPEQVGINDLPAATSDPAASALPTSEIDMARQATEAIDQPQTPAVSAHSGADPATLVGVASTPQHSKLARKTRPAIRPPAQKQLNDLDALGVLDAENRRLKALWRSRLQAENAQLREMLARLTSG